MDRAERAPESVIKLITDHYNKLHEIVTGDDEDNATSVRGDYLRHSIYLATNRRDTSRTHEAWVDACSEIRSLEGYDE